MIMRGGCLADRMAKEPLIEKNFIQKFRGVDVQVFLGDLFGLFVPKQGHDTGYMYIRSSHCTEKELLETIIHESLHACYYEIPDELVRLAAIDITELLWRVGYRRKT
jgi:hypothetical protein